MEFGRWNGVWLGYVNRGERRWDGAIEGVLAEVEDDELGELGYEWSECARVALRVKGDGDDSG